MNSAFPIRFTGSLKLLIVLMPILELFAFVAVVRMIGFFPSILLVFLSSCLGGWVLRRQGQWAFWRMQAQKDQSMSTMFQSFFLMLGGFLLVLPGFITDVIGILCLLPNIRQLFADSMIKQQPQPKNDEKYSGETLEGEYWRED